MRGMLLAVVLAVFGVDGVVAAEPELPSIPDKPAAELFKDVPAPWRDYLIKARAAERIADPLQRCLTYPDIPGNQWPKGHVDAHCHAHVLTGLPATEFNRMLDAKRYVELEALLGRMLGRHFVESDFSEEIDYVFDAFTPATPEVDARTSTWVEGMPDSPYARLARGIYLLEAGIEARGSEFIGNTPRAQLQKMSELFAQAVPELEQAVRLQPKLMPAHAWLLVVAMYDSDAVSASAAIAAAKKQDPACQTVFMRRMNALRPRWGGSYDEMLSLAGELSQHMTRRPQLAIYLSAPYGERANMLIADDKLNRETADMLDIAVRLGSADEALHDAANVAFNAEDDAKDQWKALAHLLQEARFRDGGAWANRNIARMLVRREPEWAMRHARQSLASESDSAASQYYLAATYYNTRLFEAAQAHYLLAAKDKEWEQGSLDDLVKMWMFDAGLSPKEGSAKAKPYLDRLIREYPDDGRARLYRLKSEGALHGTISDEIVAAFEQHADPKDPMQADFLKRIRDARKNPIIRNAPAKAK